MIAMMMVMMLMMMMLLLLMIVMIYENDDCGEYDAGDDGDDDNDAKDDTGGGDDDERDGSDDDGDDEYDNGNDGSNDDEARLFFQFAVQVSLLLLLFGNTCGALSLLGDVGALTLLQFETAPIWLSAFTIQMMLIFGLVFPLCLLRDIRSVCFKIYMQLISD
jgi:hypothetical protein